MNCRYWTFHGLKRIFFTHWYEFNSQGINQVLYWTSISLMIYTDIVDMMLTMSKENKLTKLEFNQLILLILKSLT